MRPGICRRDLLALAKPATCFQRCCPLEALLPISPTEPLVARVIPRAEAGGAAATFSPSMVATLARTSSCVKLSATPVVAGGFGIASGHEPTLSPGSEGHVDASAQDGMIDGPLPAKGCCSAATCTRPAAGLAANADESFDVLAAATTEAATEGRTKRRWCSKGERLTETKDSPPLRDSSGYAPTTAPALPSLPKATAPPFVPLPPSEDPSSQMPRASTSMLAQDARKEGCGADRDTAVVLSWMRASKSTEPRDVTTEESGPWRGISEASVSESLEEEWSSDGADGASAYASTAS